MVGRYLYSTFTLSVDLFTYNIGKKIHRKSVSAGGTKNILYS